MQVWRDVAEIPPDVGPTVVTIGNFDGVHLGHRHVMRRARELAAEHRGLPVVAVTFDPHPLSVVAPDRAPQPLSSFDERLAMLGEAGADAVLVWPSPLCWRGWLPRTSSPRSFSTTSTPPSSWSGRTSVSATAR